MHQEELWAGPELKLEYAHFHYIVMTQSIAFPHWRDDEIAQMATGTIIDTGWQRRLYAHFDAFLSAARSIPEIVQCCFGFDQRALRKVKQWFAKLDAQEQLRRRESSKQFAPAYNRFRDNLPLSNTRHIIEHRTGVAPVEVTINSLFGVSHVGGPTKRVPLSETRTLPDPDLQWMAKPVPVPQPHWEDFKVDGQPLFQEVQEYLTAASTLVSEGRNLSKLIHGTNSVTSPPP